MASLQQLMKDRDELTVKIDETRLLSLSLYAQRRALDRLIKEMIKPRVTALKVAGITLGENEGFSTFEEIKKENSK
jgi:hypothetical protein